MLSPPVRCAAPLPLSFILHLCCSPPCSTLARGGGACHRAVGGAIRCVRPGCKLEHYANTLCMPGCYCHIVLACCFTVLKPSHLNHLAIATTMALFTQ